MSNFIIKVRNTSGEEGTVLADVGFSYTDKLSDINQGQVRITGTSQVKRGLFEEGSQIFISRNGTREFHGLVNGISFLDAGGIAADMLGYEIWLGKENGLYASSPWNSTASATIASTIIGESNYFTAGTIEAGTNLDFKLEKTSSIWNAIASLNSRTGQDTGIDYPNLEVDILDHKGSQTSVVTLNDSLQIQDLVVRRTYPIANDVIVYGKGDGTNQIKSNTSAGQDASSQSTYGKITKTHHEPTVISQSEADLLANQLVARWAKPVKIYEFDVMNPNLDVISGDVITLNSKAKDLNNEEVRIIEIERGFRGNREFLTLKVANKEYSRAERSVNRTIAELQNNNRDNQTYMQGTTNVLTFSEMINADSSAPLRVKAYLSESFIRDEANNLRVNAFTLDYDVDPFRSGIGSATEDNVAPGVSGSSSNTQPGVSGSSDDTDSLRFLTSGGSLGTSCSQGTWTEVISVTGSNIGSGDWNKKLACQARMDEDSGGPEDVYFRIVNTDENKIYWSIFMKDFGNGSGESGDVVSAIIDCGEVDSSGDKIRLDAYPVTGAMVIDATVTVYHREHIHADGSYTAANHLHSDGSYAAASHNHNVNIGDGISDAGSVNATEVDIYLDFWNGSAWINKHSVLTTGATLDTDVDISNGGVYPDAAGFWQVRVYTDSVNADLLQGTIKCTHELDT